MLALVAWSSGFGGVSALVTGALRCERHVTRYMLFLQFLLWALVFALAISNTCMPILTYTIPHDCDGSSLHPVVLAVFSPSRSNNVREALLSDLVAISDRSFPCLGRCRGCHARFVNAVVLAWRLHGCALMHLHSHASAYKYRNRLDETS